MKIRGAFRTVTCALTAGVLGCNSNSGSGPPMAPTPPPATQALYVGTIPSRSVGEVSLPFSSGSTVTIATLVQSVVSLGLAFDSASNLYLTAVAGQIIVFAHPVTSASTPVATINIPSGGNATWLAIDSTNDLWVSDNLNHKVYEFTPPFSGTISPAPAITLSTGLSYPSGLAFDAAGNLYVGDSLAQNVQIFTHPIVNNESPTATPLIGAASCQGIAFDPAGNLYAGSQSGAIERYNAPTAAGGPPSIVDPAASTTLSGAYFLAVDAQGNLYVDDFADNKVYQFTAVSTTFSAISAPATSLTIRHFAVTTAMALGPP